MEFYFVRHGESEANLLNIVSNRGSLHGLTGKGKQQAAALARKLKYRGITRLYSSPLLRAVQTTEILAGVLDLPYDIVDALREYDCGIIEGKSDPASWELYHALWHDWRELGRWERRIEGGESYLDIKARFALHRAARRPVPGEAGAHYPRWARRHLPLHAAPSPAERRPGLCRHAPHDLHRPGGCRGGE